MATGKLRPLQLPASFISSQASKCRRLALFGHGAMSDLSSLCASKRTSARANRMSPLPRSADMPATPAVVLDGRRFQAVGFARVTAPYKLSDASSCEVFLA